MLARVMMFCVACLWGSTSIQAEPTVFFRGKQLSYRHFVYGEVTAASQRFGTINLGYAHGLQVEQDVGILRRTGDGLVPVGLLHITRVRPGEAIGEYDGAFRVRREDIVIVAARDLKLWEGRSRSDQLVLDSLMSRSHQGYDTGDISPALLKELGRDDQLIVTRNPPLHVNIDLAATQRPKVTTSVIRGAFRPGDGDDDGAADSLSAGDRKAAPDQATLDLESGLARFVSSSAAGKLNLDVDSQRLMARDRPGVLDLEEVVQDLNRANARVQRVIQPK